MEKILVAIDASAYATSVCRYGAWAAIRFSMPVELLHVVQRQDAVTARRDLSGSIGLGVKTELLEELVRLAEESGRAEVEKGRVLLAAGEQVLREAGVTEVNLLHRHGGVMETILEREENARILVMGKRGVDHEFAPEHIGSMIERVVRASKKPVLIVSRQYSEPANIVFAYDAGPATERALERLINSPLFAGLPVTIVMAEAEGQAKQDQVARAAASFPPDRKVTTFVERGKAEQVIPEVVAQTENALLVMGAYGHSPIRRLFLGSTTTEMIRTVKVPVLLGR